MSEHLDRQQRRDIRRAMGPEALDLVQQQMGALRTLEAHVNHTEHRQALVETLIEGRVLALEQCDYRWARGTATFWGRLRWLWRG